MAADEQRQQVINALMELAADQDFLEIGLGDIAERAGVTLADLRADYDGKFAILSDFSSRIDQTVLAGDDPGMKSEPTRERLFDVFMRRFDALAPYRAALRRLIASAGRDPLLAAALNRIAIDSQRWTLASAGISYRGPLAAVTVLASAQALALAYAEALSVWIKDDDPGLAKTMAALDKALKRLERAARMLNRFESTLERITQPSQSRRRASSSRKQDRDGDANQTTIA